MSYRVSTPRERAKRQAENEKRSERIMALKAQGLSFSIIAVRMGLSSSSVSRIAREHALAIGEVNPSELRDQVKESKMSGHSQRLSDPYNHGFTDAEVEVLARELFEQASRDDTFDDLKRRNAFNRQDAGRLRHWIRVAHALLTEGRTVRPR